MVVPVTDTLLPINATGQERALEAVTARISDVPVLVRESWDPDNCPAVVLPWLASAFSVDTWDPNWSEAQKRQTIKDSVFVHRHKGTIGAVRRALTALGIEVQVQEWFNQIPVGAPFTFRLLLNASQVGFDVVQLARLQDVVNSTKNLRSHLDRIVPSVTTRTGPVVGGVVSVGNEIVVGYDGGVGLELIIEGINNGMEPTEAAVDALHAHLTTTMTAVNYW